MKMYLVILVVLSGCASSGPTLYYKGCSDGMDNIMAPPVREDGVRENIIDSICKDLESQYFDKLQHTRKERP